MGQGYKDRAMRPDATRHSSDQGEQEEVPHCAWTNYRSGHGTESCLDPRAAGSRYCAHHARIRLQLGGDP